MFEMHPTEIDTLVGNLEHLDRNAQRQTTIYGDDGFEGVKALLPPPTRRGMVLIDPSYEDKNDYRRTLNTVRSASSVSPPAPSPSGIRWCSGARPTRWPAIWKT